MDERGMDEREKGERDTQIRRDTDVRGSLGVPPSGSDRDQPAMPEDAEEAFRRERTERGRSEDEDRMSER